MLKASVSLAIKLDLDDLKSAADMWTYCEHLHALNIVENQREVQRKLYSLDLDDDATSEETLLEVDHGCEACRDPAHITQTSSDVCRKDPWTVIPPCHCRDQCRGREGPRLAAGPVKVQR
jgi:CRISPR/Cas system-associated protein Cas10 (large subunit of type III CRISPR-Cas system)